MRALMSLDPLAIAGDRIEIVYRPPSEIRPTAGNPRTHSHRQIQQIKRSIGGSGFVFPITIDGDGNIIAGHGRHTAAIELGLPLVPTVTLTHLSPAQKKKLMIADNKIALNAGWDPELLAAAIRELFIEDVEFEAEEIGFETAEVDLMLDAQPSDPLDEDDTSPQTGDTVTRHGDVWLLGPHIIVCGDALQALTYELLLGVDRSQLTITDPPYNVKIGGNVSGLGKRQHAEFAMASGEMSQREFTEFLTKVFTLVARYSVKGALAMSFMDWRHLHEILEAGAAAFDELMNLCVWKKSNAGMGSFYRSQHELCLIFKAVAGTHINNIELGRFGRNRTNVWEYAGANAFGSSRDDDLADHPTVKPLAMIADAIKDSSKRGGLILDPFGGSGTTLLAAQRTGRRARLIELEPGYVDVTIRRWMRHFPSEPEPILRETGESYREVVERRRAENQSVRDHANVEADHEGL
jgi:DNA modification methylase